MHTDKETGRIQTHPQLEKERGKRVGTFMIQDDDNIHEKCIRKKIAGNIKQIV